MSTLPHTLAMRSVRLVGQSMLPKSSLPPEETAPRILIVASRMAAQLQAQLEQAGCVVFLCSESDSVAETIGILSPDLIVIECSASSTAFELCGEIRASVGGRDRPILLATADELDEQLVSRALHCGADDVIAAQRPLELAARLRAQVRNKRDRDRFSRVRAERDSFQIEATIDALTGVPNRRTFDMHAAAAHRAERAYALLYVDIDHFKRINDTHGHDVGDEVLQGIAKCLYKCKRVGDLVARYGGEEFIVLLPDVDADAAMAQAERYRAAVEAVALTKHHRAGDITASVGVAIRTSEDSTPAAVSRRADEALYTAKRQGRNRACFTRRASNAPPQLEAQLMTELATGRAGLPLLPEAASEALRLAEDPHTDIARIAKLVDRDPALATRFVALASSAMYSGHARPKTTTAAIIRIGLLASRDLLLQVVYERAGAELPTFNDAVERSFQRSVRSANAARMVARFIAPNYDLAYLCGLLHDIGEARIYRILAHLPTDTSTPSEIEALVARHHERAGADVAFAWKLPSDIVKACESHHQGSVAHASTPVRIVRAADALVRIVDCGEELSAPAQLANVNVLLQLGIGGSNLTFLVDELRRALAAEPLESL